MCSTKVSLLQSILFLRIFEAFFAQMCPFAMFQTKTHVAVGIAGCLGEVMANSHIELVDFML